MSKITINSFNASEAKNSFGRLIDAAQTQPIAIKRRGRNVAFVISPDNMQAIEDFYLGTKAQDIIKNGKSLGVKKTQRFLQSILNA